MDSVARRPGTDPQALRRALTHEVSDILKINTLGDYSGGVNISGGKTGGVTINSADVTIIGRVQVANIADGSPRFALVHDSMDNSLIINHANGYSGGVKISGDVTLGEPDLLNPYTSAVRMRGCNDALLEFLGYRCAKMGAYVEFASQGSGVGFQRFYGLDISCPTNEIICHGRSIRLENPDFESPGVTISPHIALEQSDHDELIINKDQNYKGGVKIEGDTSVIGKEYTEQGPIPSIVKNRQIVVITGDTILLKKQFSPIHLSGSPSAWQDEASSTIDLRKKIKELEDRLEAAGIP